jgi:ribosomal protein L11 methyltransferase
MASTSRGNATTRLVRLEADEQTARRFADLVAEGYGADAAAVSLTDGGGGRWRAEAFFRAPPDKKALRTLAAAAGPAAAEGLSFQAIAAKDWVSESLAGLKPVAAGRFIIHGAHNRSRIPVNRIGVEIEAALAFGTGHHGTTRGCLLALDRSCIKLQARRPLRILDLGTGTGVLAIAAAHATRQHVIAIDNDADAVNAARENARLNRAAPLVRVAKTNGVSRRTVRVRAPYDLVLANVLLGPLQRFASPLKKLLAPGARLVLSGLLTAQANAALAAYRGLVLERRVQIDGWTTLVLVRRGRRRRAVARHRRAS